MGGGQNRQQYRNQYRYGQGGPGYGRGGQGYAPRNPDDVQDGQEVYQESDPLDAGDTPGASEGEMRYRGTPTPMDPEDVRQRIERLLPMARRRR